MNCNEAVNKCEKAAIVIDGANMYSQLSSLGWEVDYIKLREHFEEQRDLFRAYYHTAWTEESNIKSFLKMLSMNGYVVVSKEAKIFDSKTIKGNMDVEIALDCLNIAPYVNELFLFSGDGDFRRVVEDVQKLGVKVTVVSAEKGLASELQSQADKTIFLNDIKEFIKKDN